MPTAQRNKRQHQVKDDAQLGADGADIFLPGRIRQRGCFVIFHRVAFRLALNRGAVKPAATSRNETGPVPD
jgi:hypothetical protein